ncbi:MAG TPA: hypothetical protein VFC42_07720 [Methylomirabilota bacterium]|jgi:hypothetical protein|nr:hypothetical protein [Methylomirabilota bacterium]
MRRATLQGAVAGALVGLTVVLAAGAAAQGPAVGAWATYEWRSSATVDVPVLVQQPGAAGGPATWSVESERAAPRPVFVTYAVVRGDTKTYVLQMATRLSPDGAPLSVTQVTVDRSSGKTLKAVIRDRKGVIPTPDSGFRPFRAAAMTGTPELVAVPAGRFTATKAPYRNGTVWVSDQVPVLGLVKGTFPDGQLELVKSGTAGAQDLLRS